MTQNQSLRLKCLELALSQRDIIDPIEAARKYYTFLKEKDGMNIINAAPFLVKNTN